MSNLLLEMKRITKTYVGIQALKGVDLHLRTGEVLGLVGENGAGKSTLMKILSGIETADCGQIFINGQEVKIVSPNTAQELGIGIIPQELVLVPDMTVMENVFLGRELPDKFGFLNKKGMLERTSAILSDLGSDHIMIDEKIENLPKADQQIVAIARRILKGGRIIILDEPTSSLTEKEIRKLFNVIKNVCENGASAIYISHRLEEIQEICDRVTVLRDGTLITTMEAGGKIDKQQLIRHMIGSEINDEFPHFTIKAGSEVLRVEDLSYKTNQGRIIRDVNFTLHEGEVLGITGLVGVGKSELGQTMMGLKDLLGGKIFLNGKETSISSPVDAFRKGFGYVSEDRRGEGLIPGLQSLFNMTLSSMKKITKTGIIQSAEERNAGRKYLKKMSIKKEYVQMNAEQLSGGNQQKIVIIRQLLSGAGIIIFDEPTKGIDVAAKSEIAKLISELCGEGKAVCLLSSEPREVLGISDKILVITTHGIEGPYERDALDYSRLMSIELEGATV